MEGKIVVLSAPSGAGKSTIIHSILEEGDIDLRFSVSATNRAPRPGEQHGVNYYFMTTEQFREAIAAGEFLEWEQVYPGRYYGTLRSQVERVCQQGHNAILDIDVKGALRVKELFGDRAMTIFIMPPSVEELRRRLIERGTDNPEVIDGRLAKAEYEMSFAIEFDYVVVNDDLNKAVREVYRLIAEFLSNKDNQ